MGFSFDFLCLLIYNLNNQICKGESIMYPIIINVDVAQDGSVSLSVESALNVEQTIQALTRTIELLQLQGEPVTITS